MGTVAFDHITPSRDDCQPTLHQSAPLPAPGASPGCIVQFNALLAFEESPHAGRGMCAAFRPLGQKVQLRPGVPRLGSDRLDKLNERFRGWFWPSKTLVFQVPEPGDQVKDYFLVSLGRASGEL